MPQIICITETMLGEKEKIDLEGYDEIYYNNSKIGQGGILIAVKNELKNVTVEMENIKDKYQALWIKIN